MNTVAMAKLAGLRLFATRVAPFLLNRATDAGLIWLTHVLEHTAQRPHHKAQLQRLRQLFHEGHPALELARRFLQLHPNYRARMINNLGVNAAYLGHQVRQAFAQREGIYAPFLIVISPTMRCNLRCSGCYAGDYPRGKDPLPLEVIDKVITQGKEMGTYFYTISGGEPFVRDDLLELYEKHNDCAFLIYTNGTCFTPEVVSHLQKCGNVAPAVSLEGWEEQTDYRRGKGVYAQVMEAMDALRDAGIMFGFSATATRLNAEVYLQEEFYDFMIQKGCLFGWFFIFLPVGQDSTLDLMVTPEQRDRLRTVTHHIRKTRPIFVADFWNDGCLTGGCMSGGTVYFHVNYRGDLEPCVFMHFAKDNVVDLFNRGGHLKEVLHSPLFCRIREVNRRDPNLLRPCPIIDHNQWLAEALTETGAQPTHPGADDIVGRLACGVREWGEEYGKLAERAWASGEYDWAKKDYMTWGYKRGTAQAGEHTEETHN